MTGCLSIYAGSNKVFRDLGFSEPIAHRTAHRTYVEESEKWLNLKQLAQ